MSVWLPRTNNFSPDKSDNNIFHAKQIDFVSGRTCRISQFKTFDKVAG